MRRYSGNESSPPRSLVRFSNSSSRSHICTEIFIANMFLERETGTVHTAVVDKTRRYHLHKEIKKNVAPESQLHTDTLKSYDHLPGYA
jgi:hypothetical protein